MLWYHLYQFISVIPPPQKTRNATLVELKCLVDICCDNYMCLWNADAPSDNKVKILHNLQVLHFDLAQLPGGCDHCDVSEA